MLMVLTMGSLPPGAGAQTTQVQLVIMRNDATPGGVFEIQIQLRQQSLSAVTTPSHTLCAFTADITYNRDHLSYDGYTSDLSAEGYSVTANDITSHPDTPFIRTGTTCSNVNGSFDGINLTNTYTPDLLTLSFTITPEGAQAIGTALEFRVQALHSSYTNTVATADNGVMDVPVTEAAGVGEVLLPVELVAFDAVRDGAAVVLTWQTASETNNAGFDIETRRRGPQERQGASHEEEAAWERLAFVEGHGTTAETQSYSYRIVARDPGTHRFRLKQVDYDGTFAYSPEVEVTVELAETYVLSSAYPNPFNPQTTFTLAVQQAQEVEVAVFNLMGQRVALLHRGTLDAQQTHRFTFEAGHLSSGVYVIRAVGKRFAAQRQVVLVK
jgi:hypothetical protein